MKRLIALMMILSIALCFAACGEDQNPTVTTTTAPTTVPTTTPTTVPPTSSVDNTVYNYRIRVVDQDGNPIEGAYVIFCLEQCNFYVTNAEGWALIDSPIADGYKAHIMTLPDGYEGYTFQEDYVDFTSGQTEMTLVATKPAA